MTNVAMPMGGSLGRTERADESPAWKRARSHRRRGPRPAADWLADQVEAPAMILVGESGYIKVRIIVTARRGKTLNPRLWSEWTGRPISIVTKEGLSPFVALTLTGPVREGSWQELRNAVMGAMAKPAIRAASMLQDQVLLALGDPRWQFRTVDGLARATGATPGQVRALLVELHDRVRQPLAPDPDGRELYTLASRRPTWKEHYMHLRNRLATW